MKSKLMALIMICSATTAAASASPKSCDTYMNAAWRGETPHVRLQLGLEALADAVGLTVTPAQHADILARVERFVTKYPKKQDEFEKMFFFACTTDLSADEKDQIKDQISEFQKL